LEVVLILAKNGGCARFGTDRRLCSFWHRLEVVLVAQIGGGKLASI